MPIIELQRALREAGRIRTGEKIGNRPAKLETFRLTSRDHDVLVQCASLFGGDVREWKDAPGDATQWELYTGSNVLDVIVPPSDLSFSQWYEEWNAGGCVHRCDGVTQDETTGGGACACDPENRACKMTTRLNVFLADVDGLGLWRLESHGYYAAAELRGAAELLMQAAMLGHLIPARLRLESRTRKFLRNGKSETRNYVVPILDPRISALALVGLGGGGGPAPLATSRPALDVATTPALTPVAPPPDEAEPTVAETVAAVETRAPRAPRKGAAPPLPPTGRAPRTVEQHAADLAARAGDGAPPSTADAVESVDPDAQRRDLADRLAALPSVVAAQAKAEWPTLNFPTTLKKATGWNAENLSWCERFVAAAEAKAEELAKAARQRCAIACRDLGMSDDERHRWVAEHFDGLAGLTALTLDQLDSAEAQLRLLAEEREAST